MFYYYREKRSEVKILIALTLGLSMLHFATNLLAAYLYVTRVWYWEFKWERKTLFSGPIRGITIMRWEAPVYETANRGEQIFVFHFWPRRRRALKHTESPWYL